MLHPPSRMISDTPVYLAGSTGRSADYAFHDSQVERAMHSFQLIANFTQ
jgi:hypothetical protein